MNTKHRRNPEKLIKENTKNRKEIAERFENRSKPVNRTFLKTILTSWPPEKEPALRQRRGYCSSRNRREIALAVFLVYHRSVSSLSTYVLSGGARKKEDEKRRTFLFLRPSSLVTKNILYLFTQEVNDMSIQ